MGSLSTRQRAPSPLSGGVTRGRPSAGRSRGHKAAVLDRRLLPGEDPDAAFREIQEVVQEVAGWSIEVTHGAFMYPSEVAQDAPVNSAIRELTKSEAKFFYSPAALDAGFLNRHGIETIMLGPGDLRFAHTDQDVVPLQEVRDAARVYAATALQLLASPPSQRGYEP